MRRTARGTALSGLVAVLVTIIVPAASAKAIPPDTLTGGCGFTSEGDAGANGGVQQGIIYDQSASRDATGAPSWATVWCWIDINGSEYSGTRLAVTGDGSQSGENQIRYVANDTDTVTLCQQVDFWDGSPWFGPDGTNPDCRAATEFEVPPQVVSDAVDTAAVEVATLQRTVINTTLCPLLVQAHDLTGGGLAGVVLIGSDGDLFVKSVSGAGYNQVYDCPPYDGFNLVNVNVSIVPTIITIEPPPA